MNPLIDIDNSRAVLFVTNSPDKVKQFLTPLVDNNNFFDFPTCSRETIITITRLYRDARPCTILLRDLCVPVALALLVPVEKGADGVRLFATVPSLDRVPPPLLARFTVKYLDREENPIAREFIDAKNLKTIPDDLSFYVDLAELVAYHGHNITHNGFNVNTFLKKDVKNLELIGEILRDIRLCTNNIFWKYHFERLKRGFVWG